MKRLLYLVVASICIANTDAADNRTCPIVPSECKCSYRENVGFKISCSDKEIETISFKSIPSDVVVDIFLNNNNLKEINSSTFPHPNSIRKLYIRNNFLIKIGDGTFEGFNNLRRLDLSQNYLTELSSQVFNGLDNASLSLLDLNENRILRISPNAFMNLKIEILDLSSQFNIHNKNAELISYSDFLTRSLVKEISLKQNYLLCDCNQNWLLKWLEDPSHKIDEEATCFYPSGLRHTRIVDLYALHSWNCSYYSASFQLPTFNLSLRNDQILFERDAFRMRCSTTWLEQSTISWLHNGVPISSKDPNVVVKRSFNLTLGRYISQLTISKLSSRDSGTITCEVKVRHSGRSSLSRLIRVIDPHINTCAPTVSRTNRGVIRWPTALEGALVETVCPKGSLNDQHAFYTCSNGTWNDLHVKNCLLLNHVTRKLQEFYTIARTHDISDIKDMIKQQFLDVFPYSLKSKHDLFYLSKMFEEIMNTFKGQDGKRYSEFFWKNIGVLADGRIKISAMKRVVNGYTSGWRFRSLLERYIFDQIELRDYKTTLKVSTHHSIAATSVSRKDVDLLACYVIPAQNRRTDFLRANCYTQRNFTAYQLSSVSLSVDFGKQTKFMRVTLLTFETSVFFQTSRTKLLAKTHMLSPILGVKINEKLKDGTGTTIVSDVMLSFSNEYFNGENANLVYWSSTNVSDANATWENVTWCVRNPFSIIDTKNVTQYRCSELPTPHIVYFALLKKAPQPIILFVNYLEPIVYIMAAFCCLFLISTLIVYAYFSYYRQLLYNRSDAATLINLCLVLLITEMIFACGIHRTDDALLCKGVAVALHYFVMCAYVWLGCSGVVLLRLVKKKDRANVSGYDPVLKYYLVGWGIPLVICSITLAYDNEQYGTQQNCWLSEKLSMSAFVGPGSVILVGDLIIFLYLHAVINRLFPKPLDDEPRIVDSSDEEEDENCNQQECHVNKCRYKIQPKKYPTAEFRFPKRKELISYLYGCLLVLLLLCLTFTGIVMIYSYQGSKANYLYMFFSYGSAICNLLIGVIIFYYHCIKRRDIFKHLLQVFHNIRHRQPRDTPCTTETEILMSSRERDGSPHILGGEDVDEDDDDDEHPLVDDKAHGVYGLSDHIPSEGSQIMATVHVENCKTFDGRGESSVEGERADEGEIPGKEGKVPENESDDFVPDTLSRCNSNAAHQSMANNKRAPMSHSDYSDQDKKSNTQNSIGECSLASSRPKRPLKNIQIPSHLKDFVPENWRPARRRNHKDASYYPYYISENNPISASLAYCSKSSSLASTTVSGVPLYLKNGQIPNGNMQPPPGNRLGLQPMGIRPTAINSVPRPSVIFPNIPMRYPPPVYHNQLPSPAVPNAAMMLQPVPKENSHTSLTENSPSVRSLEVTNENIDDSVLTSENPSSESEEETPPMNVAPDLYIPMPHVSIKQFTLRSETSV